MKLNEPNRRFGKNWTLMGQYMWQELGPEMINNQGIPGTGARDRAEAGTEV